MPEPIHIRKARRNKAKTVLAMGGDMETAAEASGLKLVTVQRMARDCKDFMQAVRQGEQALADIALAGVTKIALNECHTKHLEACQTLLKHERSGGYGSERHEHIFLPAEADPLDQ